VANALIPKFRFTLALTNDKRPKNFSRNSEAFLDLSNTSGEKIEQMGSNRVDLYYCANMEVFCPTDHDIFDRPSSPSITGQEHETSICERHKDPYSATTIVWGDDARRLRSAGIAGMKRGHVWDKCGLWQRQPLASGVRV